jgi:hypothetical protein
LTAAVDEGRRIPETERREIEAQNHEIDYIITQAREASASAGTAVFTSAFLNEAVNQNASAKQWLIATACFATVTLVAAIVM